MISNHYDLADLYSKIRLNENINVDHGNSYETDINKSGYGPSNAGETDPANNDTPVLFGSHKPLELDDKKNLLIKFLQDEIDGENKVDGDDSWSEETLKAFELLLAHLIDKPIDDSSDDD